jgi:hypothetical protein
VLSEVLNSLQETFETRFGSGTHGSIGVQEGQPASSPNA